MDATVRFVLSLSIVFAVIIGIVRYRKIESSYYPFIYYVTLALVMELLVHFLTGYGFQKLIIGTVHVYSFIEFYLFAWLFHNWGLFNRRKDVFWALIGIFFVAWALISFFIHGLKELNYYFLILYSFALIFFSVSSINKMVVHERGNIFRNPKFLICLGIIIFYTFFILVNVTYLSIFKQNDNISKVFRGNLHKINVYSNLLVNFLYAVAIIWIPRKQNFTIPF